MAIAGKSRYDALMQISLFEIVLLLAAAAIAAPIAERRQVGTVPGHLPAAASAEGLLEEDAAETATTAGRASPLPAAKPRYLGLHLQKVQLPARNKEQAT